MDHSPRLLKGGGVGVIQVRPGEIMPQFMDHDADGCLVISVDLTKLCITAIMEIISQGFSIQNGRCDIVQVPTVRPDIGCTSCCKRVRSPATIDHNVQFIVGDIAIAIGIVGA